jgi:hypothetical protein
MTLKLIAETIRQVFESPNEMDQNGECANVVDGLFAIARALQSVAWEIGELRLSQKEKEE